MLHGWSAEDAALRGSPHPAHRDLSLERIASEFL